MKKVKLALGIHNHQPVGNFDFVFEQAYKRAYLPFLELLEKHPKIRIAQHYTGILFEWILNRYPEFTKRLRRLVQRGQIEMMTGGYYEPILINIPDEDKLGQIKKLTRFVRQKTGYDPIGMWLAERIWEPQLPKPLVAANIKYAIVDDSHFKTAGLKQEDLYGYYLTEDTGAAIAIFPICEKLRYTIPFQEPEATIEYLQSIATEDGNNLVVFADDGEKFGIWPDTFEHCYENNWLEQFFSTLEANLDWIEIIHFSEALDQLLPTGNIYLPTASYREMMEWALPTNTIHQYEDFEQQLKNNGLFNQYKVFVRGGFWRNFLVKYPESNNLHKKALYVSKKLKTIKRNFKNKGKLQQAYDHSWAGQCNCPYWHGVFGGLYLPHIRNAVYRNMIQAETLIDQLIKNDKQLEQGWIDVQSFDFNADGQDELIVETDIYNLYFSPHIGGTLFEIDFKPKAINLLDTMTRREEGYHRKLLTLKDRQNEHHENNEIASIHDKVITKEEGLDKKLFYDWYRRTSLVDHFLSPETSLEVLANSNYDEMGDFIIKPYIYETKKQSNKLIIQMGREGVVWIQGIEKKILLEKMITIQPKDSRLEYTYRLHNLENETIDLWFAVEFNTALLAGDAPDRYYYFEGHQIDDPKLASMGIVNDVTKMGLKDEWQGLDVNFLFDRPTTVWRFPIETISQSEGGFERVYQSSVVLPNWKIKLQAQSEWKATMFYEILI